MAESAILNVMSDVCRLKDKIPYKKTLSIVDHNGIIIYPHIRVKVLLLITEILYTSYNYPYVYPFLFTFALTLWGNVSLTVIVM